MTVSPLLPIPPSGGAAVQSRPEPFDLCGELPIGTTVLEASAGTGKTYTIAGLVARYVAEGRARMDQLLVVSFSRESTRELRERVRARLVQARDRFDAEPPRTATQPDRLLDQLVDVSEPEAGRRRRRLEQALASFDAATVTTTHGFCQQMLLALGTAGDHDPDVELLEDTRDLVQQIADDLYLRKWGAVGSEPATLRIGEFRELASAVALDRISQLMPGPGAPDPAGLRVRVAEAVRGELEHRIRRLRLLSYDDMLLRLAATLRDGTLGTAARERLCNRYQIVLVDEFQDTDPVQWTILRDAFHGRRTMVLIGDPKQSIYAFRGADVHSYLQAAATASSTRTLDCSYRSDELLQEGLRAVFRGAALGDDRIRVLPVRAAHTGRLVRTPGPPIRLRVLPRDGLPLLNSGLPTVAAARQAVAADVASEAAELLGTARLMPRGDRNGAERSLQPGDIAVLVRTNEQAQLVSRQLAAIGVPAVVTGRRSVFDTAAAHDWQLLLEALEQPNRGTLVRRLALGCFIGRTAAELGEDPERITEQLCLDLRRWSALLAERGVSALFEAVCLTHQVQPRVLGSQGGERILTDLRHIAQVLHEAGVAGGLGLTALLGWLRRRREEAASDSGLERSRRLESDAAAVQVITVHTSKGLEFPAVLVPFAWDLHVRSTPATAAFHDTDGQRLRDVGGPGGPAWRLHVQQHRREEIDDELRLAYVALTRAQSHLVLWWAPSANTMSAPLHRLLLNPDPELPAPLTIPVLNDAAMLAAFEQRAAGSAGGLAVETIQTRTAASWQPERRRKTSLRFAIFDRDLDLRWRRTSYSALTAAVHEEQRLGSEPDVPVRDDELDLPAEPVTGSADDEPLRSVPSGWDALPGGPRFGTVVHAVLERLTDPGDPAAVRDAVSATVRRFGPTIDVDTLAAGLREALATPLGPLAAGRALAGFGVRDRLPELEFELPLGGGDGPAAGVGVLRDLVLLWRRHCPEGPLAGYPEALAGLDPAPLRGYLTGSIDAVLRVPGPAYLVVDYKTNRLGGIEEPLTAWHYRPEALQRAMIEAHYPLQALLYDVALHRYLRWRQPGYRPEQHLGGVLYLFLRGMTGQARRAGGSAPGVFEWRPPTDLVLAASDLLAGTR